MLLILKHDQNHCLGLQKVHFRSRKWTQMHLQRRHNTTCLNYKTCVVLLGSLKCVEWTRWHNATLPRIFLAQAVCKISFPPFDWLYISQEMVTMATFALTRIAPLTGNILFTVLLFFHLQLTNSTENVFVASYESVVQPQYCDYGPVYAQFMQTAT